MDYADLGPAMREGHTNDRIADLEAEVARLKAVLVQFQTVIDGITKAFEEFQRP